MFKMAISKVGVVALVLLAGCAGEAVKDSGAAEAAVTRSWTMGESFVYEVDSTRSVSMGDFRSHLRAELALTVVGETDKGAYEVRGEVKNARYEQTPAEDLGADLAKPFFFTISPTGKVEGFRFSRGVASAAAAQQRELVLSLQLVEPSEDGSAEPAWKTVEHDSTGDYDASYTRDGKTVHKVKVAYLPKAGAPGPTAIPGFDKLTIDASSDYTLDAHHWPRTVKEHESAMAASGQLVVRSEKASTLSLVRVEKRPALIGSMEKADLVSEGVMDQKARALAKIQADKGLVGERTFAQLTMELGAEDAKVHNPAILAMAALIRLDKAAAESARAEMVNGNMDVRAKKRLAAALGAGGTPEAQRALVSLIDPSLAKKTPVIDAIVALALTKAPTDETGRGLLGFMGSEDAGIVSTATLATGAVIRSMTKSAAGDTGPLLDALIDRLSRASTTQDKELGLSALGNTGHPRALSAIEPYLRSEDVSLRAAAVHGMRFMEGDVANRAVIAGLSDAENEVQKAAADTLRYRPIEPVLPAVDAWLANGPEKTARAVAVRGLKAQKKQLAWVVDHGTGEQTRRIARALLQGKE